MPLHHHIARPISLHHHKPISKTLHNFAATLAFGTVLILGLLMYFAYIALTGAPIVLLAAILAPLVIAIILFIFFMMYRRTFYRDYHALKKKFSVKYAHSYKHN